MIFVKEKGRRTLTGVVATAFVSVAGTALAAEADLPSREEMWSIIQTQQDEIERLKGTVDALKDDEAGTAPAEKGEGEPPARVEIEALEKRVTAAEEKIEATGAAVERRETGGGGWWDRTSIGGYGELHYSGGDKDQVDFHRFVLFVGHEFNDWIRLQTELELEHSLSGDGQPGEVELEQAFVEFDLTEGAGFRFGQTDRHMARAGLMLVPVGILNETHEPPTYFGVERNNVEKNIIPTTWWEAGAGMAGQFGQGFSYDLLLHSGLEVSTTGGGAFTVRGGRNKVAKAPANDPAVTARLRWNGMPGVEIGVTGQYQADVTQGVMDVDATLIEAHADIRRGPFGVRALYARWDLSGAAPRALGRDEQYGWYIEPSYRFDTAAGEIGFFTRYLQWDNEAGLAADTKTKQAFLGMNYWPHPNVVLKVDYQFDNPPAGEEDDDRINLGLGFQF